MTGPEHYSEAERHLSWSAQVIKDVDPAGTAEWQQRQAQVHAILALAAATALGHEGEGRMMPGRERQAWFDVAGEYRKAQS